jgi:hypothetical protein
MQMNELHTRNRNSGHQITNHVEGKSKGKRWTLIRDEKEKEKHLLYQDDERKIFQRQHH